MNLATRITVAVQRAGWLPILLLLPLLALAALGAARVGVDNSVHVWFVEGDPALEAYDGFHDTFGNDEVVVFAVREEGGALSEQGVARQRAIVTAADATDGIADATALTNLSHVRVEEGWEPNPLEAPPLEVARVVPDEGGAQELLERRVEGDPLLRTTMLSEDRTTAAVFAQMEALDDMDARRDGILGDLDARLSEAGEQDTPRAGIGVIFSALNQASTRDVGVVIGASYLVIAVLLGVLFGRVGPVLVSLGVVGASATLIMGVYGAMGRDINMVTMALPTLVLIIGVADCVHMLHRVADQEEGDQADRIRVGISAVLWPCLFTSLTTAAGFLALASARMQVVRDLGWFAAVAVLIAFAVSVVGVVAALRFRALEPRRRSTEGLSRVLVRLGDLSMARRREVLGLAAVVALIGTWGISRIDADTYSIDYFYASHRVRQDSSFIEQHFGYYTPLELVVETPDGGRNVETLKAIAAWEDAMVKDPDVGWTRSAADVVRRLNQVLSDGEESSYVVPPDDLALEQAMLTYESDPDADMSDLVSDPEWSQLRVTAGVRMMSSNDIGSAVHRLTAMADLPEGHRIVPSGYLPLYVTMMDYVVRSQVTSFALAFFIVFGLLALLFRSIRMALLAVPGNLLPLLFTLGVMGFAGIRLDVATVTIAAIVLGLVVDDTTHFLYRFREGLRAGLDHEAAVREALRTSGVAMLVTTVVLVCGFAVLGLASVKSVAYFGLLAAVAMATAVVADLVVLPALLVTLKPKL